MDSDQVDRDDDLAERVTRLEERVAHLERTPPAGAEAGDAGEPAPGAFWALDGLRERVSEPGAVLFTGTVTLPTGQHFDWQQGVTAARILEEDWSEFAGTLAALAHPVRLLLLREILRGARSTAELAALERLGTTGQLYHHLRQLVSAGWLRTTARGQYEVPGDRVVPLLTVLTAAGR